MEWINNSRKKLNLGNISLALIFLAGILLVIFAAVSAYVKLFGSSPSPKSSISEFSDPMPVKTNSWFSSLYKFPTEPIYIHPLVAKFDSEGLNISYPAVSISENTVSASYQRHCLVSFGEEIRNITVKKYSDWQVEVELSENESVILTKGSPFIYIKGNNLSFNCTSNSSLYVVQKKENMMRVAALFDDDPESKTLLENSDWAIPSSTEAKWGITANQYITEYLFKGLTENSYMVLYPHQYNNLSGNLAEVGKYETALGTLKVFKGNRFSTSTSTPDLKNTFVKVKNEEYKNQIIEAIGTDIEKFSSLDFPDGVYFKGTMLGAVTSLVQLTAIYAPERLDEVLDILEQELTSSLEEFEYSDEKKMLVAKIPEFGNEEGNDHHFHYGYYVRAAAVLKNHRNGALENDEIIDQMIEDIASLKSDKYPRLRSFSVYEGHSWADGDASFADGNNQESTSEALNAWYAVYLWGKVNDDQDLINLGQWLYSQELIGTTTYWFGIDNPFSDDYDHQMASIVWGAKRDFATWFSGEAMHIYGIQFLPITPASSYHLSAISDEKYVLELEAAYSSPETHEWGDLYISYLSFVDPEQAFSLLPAVNSTEGMKLKSLLLQTVFNNYEQR